MSIEKINEHLTKVKAMIHGQDARTLEPGQVDELSSMTQVTKILNEVKTKLREVNNDLHLSAMGKAAKERELKHEAAVEIAKLARSYKTEIDKELDEAEKAAKAVIATANPTPDQHAIDEFTRKYNELKTELTVFGTKQSAQNMLAFIKETDNPYFASKLVEDFAEYGQALRKHIDHTRLQTDYTTLKTKAESDEKSIARKKLDEIANFRKASPINPMAVIGIESRLGKEYRDVTTNYEKYIQY